MRVVSTTIKVLKNLSYCLIILFLVFFIINSLRIYSYSSVYSNQKSDVAVVLGAGTKDGRVSPVYRERINHGIYLYKEKIVEKLIFTGGYGKNQRFSDSKVAEIYAIEKGVNRSDIFIESTSQYTYQNLRESKKIMDSLKFKTALIVSDPLHMKRAMLLTKKEKIKGQPSPTQTSMYRTNSTKLKSLLYEAFYFTLREVKEIFAS